MNRPLSTIVYWIFCMAALLILTCAGGCVPSYRPPPVADDAPLLASSLSAADAHVESADRLVGQAAPHADQVGKAYLDAAHGEHVAAHASNLAARSDLGKVEGQTGQLRGQVARATAAHDQLAAKWYVRWGVRAERWFWATVLTWAALGVASVLVLILAPAGWLAAAAKVVRSFLPAFNVFELLAGVGRKFGGVALKLIFNR